MNEQRAFERGRGRVTEFASNNNNKIIVVFVIDVVVVIAIVFMINESDYRFNKMPTILPLKRTRFAFLLFYATRKKKLIVIFNAGHFEVFFLSGVQRWLSG